MFNSGQIYYSNNADKETNFQDEVDNQTPATDVKNFMIGPVFGVKGAPNGIIQFINKTGEEKIGAEEIRKFKEMSSLLGMCIDNTNEIASTIEITLNVNDAMNRITTTMEAEQAN